MYDEAERVVPAACDAVLFYDFFSFLVCVFIFDCPGRFLSEFQGQVFP
jgi:hypothetical protein